MDMGVNAAKQETAQVAHHADAVFDVRRRALEDADGLLLDRGKCTVIRQRHGEGWKRRRDIWNTSQSA